MALMAWAPVDYLRLRPWLRAFRGQVLLVPSRDLMNRTTRPEVRARGPALSRAPNTPA